MSTTPSNTSCYMVTFSFSVDGQAQKAVRTPQYGRELPNISPAFGPADQEDLVTEVLALESLPLHALRKFNGLDMDLIDALPVEAASLTVAVDIQDDATAMEQWKEASDHNQEMARTTKGLCRSVSELMVTFKQQKRGETVLEMPEVKKVVRPGQVAQHTFSLSSMSKDHHDERFLICIEETDPPVSYVAGQSEAVDGLACLTRSHSRLPLQVG